ncbi:MAG: hypothetical protein E7774_15560 [Bradyrhizobium sp.]|nr:MAG: hypothetical protein E7774_15560 [Bradyrhizobium sp.]
MTGRADPAESLAASFAYVDNCLDAPARRAFEARLAGDMELRRQVAQWQAQNREIRCAFGAPALEPLDLGRVSNENVSRRGKELAARLEEAPRPFDQMRLRRPPARKAADRGLSAPSAVGRSVIALLALTTALLAAAPPSLGRRAPAGLLDAGLAAASALGKLPVEFAPNDPALARRFGPRFAIAPPQARGLRLIGLRLAPGEHTAAALYVYEDARGERAALMVEPFDEIAPAPARRGARGALSAVAWTGAGYGFVAVAAAPDDLAALSEAVALER